jgi:hypothetical protein
MARMPHPAATTVLARAIREWSGWFVVAAGAVLCVLGWYGISGESVIEQQLPYLASATIPGAALIVAGAFLIAARPARRTEAADERIETLYGLLVTDAETGGDTTRTMPRADADADAEALLAVPGGTLYHRRDCPLVADKPNAEVVDAGTITERSLTPCPVCEPPGVVAMDGGSGPDQPGGGSDHPDPDSGPAPAPDRDADRDAAPDPDRDAAPDPRSGPTPPGP